MVSHQALERIAGKAEALECRGSLLRLRIQVEKQQMVFAIRDPKQIVVRNTKDGYVDFACGPMKAVSVTVLFTPDKTGVTRGQVQELEF
jgi:hypothetical protein